MHVEGVNNIVKSPNFVELFHYENYRTGEKAHFSHLILGNDIQLMTIAFKFLNIFRMHNFLVEYLNLK